MIGMNPSTLTIPHRADTDGDSSLRVKGSPHLVLHDTGSDCMANTKQSPRQQSEAEVSEAEVKCRGKADGAAERTLTWEDENEEGADASDDTDDLADVWEEHGDDQRGYEPQHRQRVAAAVLKLRRPPAATPSPPAQQRLLDHWPGLEEQVDSGSTGTLNSFNKKNFFICIFFLCHNCTLRSYSHSSRKLCKKGASLDKSKISHHLAVVHG